MTPDVTLRPMREDELPGFRDAFIRGWADDLVRVEGLTAAAARARAAEELDAAFRDGVATPPARLYVIVGDGRPVGTLWLDLDGGPHAHLADIAIDEPFRGRGYGRRALELAEEEAIRAGATSIGLHVYADNERARRLYEAAGYRTAWLSLRKPLS